MEKQINLTLLDILNLAKENPEGTQLTSEVEEYMDEKGDKITKFKILA